MSVDPESPATSGLEKSPESKESRSQNVPARFPGAVRDDREGVQSVHRGLRWTVNDSKLRGSPIPCLIERFSSVIEKIDQNPAVIVDIPRIRVETWPNTQHFFPDFHVLSVRPFSRF